MANTPSPEDRAIVAMAEAAVVEAEAAGGDDEEVRLRAISILSRRISATMEVKRPTNAEEAGLMLDAAEQDISICRRLLSALKNFSLTRSLH
jgi:hypothetical protein